MHFCILLLWASLRFPVVFRGHTFSAAIEAAHLETVSRCLSGAGGGAATFRQLKDVCDDLCSGFRKLATNADLNETYSDACAAASSLGVSGGKHAQIYEERFNIGDRRGGAHAEAWYYSSGKHYANESTRNFNRSYSANYCDPCSTGFTREELAGRSGPCGCICSRGSCGIALCTGVPSICCSSTGAAGAQRTCTAAVSRPPGTWRGRVHRIVPVRCTRSSCETL
ncbi:hypothetical protein LSCM1_01330 [Leishmania martiniquensis]|uniref:Uncharacterized protein n=1 Tax=Leishmania martiniquensis TaxID=1580590 RepID=A0A836GNZ7_9TRYP|nr:hypothetical protein LSCM1_01330 [Leishmania martiniquensis]